MLALNIRLARRLSLGGIMSSENKRSKRSALEEQRFQEWRLLKQNINEFVGYLQSRVGDTDGGVIDHYGFGNPRSYNLCVTFSGDWGAVYKSFRVNITVSSWQGWIERFDRMKWSAKYL